MFAREGGGRIEGLPTALPAELDGLEDVDMGFRVEGLTGSRLGDWLLVSIDFDSPCRALLSIDSAIGGRPYLLLPVSAGLRNERVREGKPDIL
jgi:hypothetical protein